MDLLWKGRARQQLQLSGTVWGCSNYILRVWCFVGMVIEFIAFTAAAFFSKIALLKELYLGLT